MNETEFSFKNYFVPLTTAKAVTWIIVIGFTVYFTVFFNGFVWDDFPFIFSSASFRHKSI
jgi:hypothetical protein